MSPENKNSPEVLDRPRTIEQLMLEYSAYIEQAHGIHERTFDTIYGQYTAQIETEAIQPGSIDVQAVLLTTETAVDEAVLPLGDSLSTITSALADEILGHLSDEDQFTLRKAREMAGKFGVGNAWTIDALDNASSDTVRLAMQVSLDDLVLAKVRKDARTFGVNNMWTEQALELASSDNVRNAMRASLDDMVLEKVKKAVGTFGVNNMWTEQALETASSDTVRRAIRVSLDRFVFDTAREKTATFGMGNKWTEQALDAASSVAAKHVFKEMIEPSQNVPEYTPENQPKDAVVDTVVDDLIAKDRGLSWLADAKADVRRVIDTINRLRNAAIERGEPVPPDSIIYRKYRMKIETAESEEQARRLNKSFQILNAMMGNNHKGKIPYNLQ